MEKTFGNLEFAGEDKTEQRRINGRMAVLSRSFNLYSDVQRADDIVVILPAEAGEKHFNFEERVKLAAPDQQQRELNILIIVQLLKKSIGITNQCVE